MHYDNLLRCLCCPVTALMGRIEDVIVKTILSVEFSVGTACRMFVPYKSCCFGKYFRDLSAFEMSFHLSFLLRQLIIALQPNLLLCITETEIIGIKASTLFYHAFRESELLSSDY